MLRDYAESLDGVEYKQSIINKDYISEEDALKIVAVSTIEGMEVREYITNVNEMEIELIKNQENEDNNIVTEKIQGIFGTVKSKGTYWRIILIKRDSSYIEKAQINIDYNTGEILYSGIISQLNVD